jgi:hypothetical protein
VRSGPTIRAGMPVQKIRVERRGSTRSRVLIIRNCKPGALNAICGPFARQRMTALFDHLISLREQRGGHRQAERLGCLEVDRKFVLCRLRNRQVGGLRTFENSSGINSSLPVYLGKAGCVADPAAAADEFDQIIRGRKRKAHRLADDLLQ